jgi:uncharacterized membrane protein
MMDYSEKDFFIKPTRKGVADFEDLLDADYQVKSTEWVKSGWNIFKKDAALSIAFAFLALVCYLLINFIPFVGILFFYPFIAGFIVISLMVFQNKSLAFKNYFWGFRHCLPLLVFSIVSTIFIFIGILLLVIPGIYLTVAYTFAPYLIVEKNIDFWPAMEISRKKVDQHWFGILGLCCVVFLINIIGCIPLFLGLFVTLPLSISIFTAAYNDIFMQKSGTDTPEESVQPVV